MNIKQIPASPHNLTRGRGGHKVNRVIIHVQDGTQVGSISWFQNAASNVSAHYLISTSGEIVQMVAEGDTAWQAGDFLVNQTSIGIEHEGQPSKGPWAPSRLQLEASAALVADICKRYDIAPSVQTIIPHSKVNPKHNCPGPTWPWAAYLSMVGAILNPPAPAHSPEVGKTTITLYDPGTNLPVGKASLIDGTLKAYIVPNV